MARNKPSLRLHDGETNSIRSGSFEYPTPFIMSSLSTTEETPFENITSSQDSITHLNWTALGTDDVTSLYTNSSDLITYDNHYHPITGLHIDHMWYTVHITAVFSLGVSLIASTSVVCYLFLTNPEKRFFKWRLSERLVIYIAFSDLFYSLEHIIDHGYLLAKWEFPEDIFCAILGFFLQEFATSQSLIVFFTALNAFALIVKERNLPMGKYDCILLIISFGTPVVCGAIVGALGLLGPSEVW